MLWPDVRKAYPNQWLVIEALEAHTTPDNQRKLDTIAVIESCNDGNTAMNIYRQLHLQFPTREFYYVHTGRKEPDIRERQWARIRRNNAVVTEG